eukprot:360689-Chlamydomonas_euryale.AAC.4
MSSTLDEPFAAHTRSNPATRHTRPNPTTRRTRPNPATWHACSNPKPSLVTLSQQECDVALIVLDGLRLLPLAAPGAAKAALRDALKWELQLMQVLTGRGSVGEQRAVARIVR